MTGLPVADTREEFSAVCADETVLRPGVNRLCRLLDVDTTGLVRVARGSVPVYAAGHLVLKLFPPVHMTRCHVEAGVLNTVKGRLPTRTPRVHAVGEHDGWGYILMTRLPGVELESVWDLMTAVERNFLAAQLGETLAALHRVQPPVIDQWEPADWPAFCAQRRAESATENRALGLAPGWAHQIPAFLDRVMLSSGPVVLLHTEVTRHHVLVTRTEHGRWRLSGLFGFASAIRGVPGYEFAVIGVSIARGDARLLRRVLTSYGYPSDQLGPDLSRQLLAWALLRRGSDLASWLQRLPAPDRPTLDALASRWFGTSQRGDVPVRTAGTSSGPPVSCQQPEDHFVGEVPIDPA